MLVSAVEKGARLTCALMSVSSRRKSFADSPRNSVGAEGELRDGDSQLYRTLTGEEEEHMSSQREFTEWILLLLRVPGAVGRGRERAGGSVYVLQREVGAQQAHELVQTLHRHI